MKYVCDICGYHMTPSSAIPRTAPRSPRHTLEEVPEELDLPPLLRREGPVQPGRIKEPRKQRFRVLLISDTTRASCQRQDCVAEAWNPFFEYDEFQLYQRAVRFLFHP